MIEAMRDSARQRIWRIIVLATVLLAGVIWLGARLVYWQALRPDLVPQAKSFRSQLIPWPPGRGSIQDRTGHLLVTEIANYNICCCPANVKNREEVAERLAPLTGKTRNAILEILAESEGQQYARLAVNIPAARAKVVESWELPGVYLEPTPSRGYPESDLAGQLLGFVTMANKGCYGVEGWYDRELAGEAGYERIYDGPWGSVSVELRPARDGADLVLTIGRAIQYEAEKLLRNAVRDQQAKSGTIIVMQPKTGEILAMANYPSYEPSRYAEISEDLYRNPAISEQYEPGSVFKIITMAAGLDSGLVTRDTSYIDNGYIFVGGVPIRNWDGKAYGPMTMAQLLAYSLNVGAATISTGLRADRFYDYVHRFGFGKPTDVDLEGEAPGVVHIPGDPNWSEGDLGTNSFGQGIAVTPLQMVNAVAAVANGGLLMRPHVVKEIHQGNQTKVIEPVAVRRVISERVARDLTEMLVEAVETKSVATVEGYRVAGKTGTAQIPIPGGYDPDPTAVIASFVGYAPADDPQFIALVKIDRPKAERWGETVAAPVFCKLAKRLFTLLDIPPDSVRLARQELDSR